MGILDDAIREHLELKRAHGASDDEIARKEAEAFGPARQEAAPDETSVVIEPAEFAEPVAAEPAPDALDPEAGFDSAFADEPPPPLPPEPVHDLEPEPVHDLEPEPDTPFRPVEPIADAPGFDPAAPADAPLDTPPAGDAALAPAADPLDQPTEDFDPFAEPEPAAEAAPPPVRHFDDEHAPPEPVFPAGERPAPVEEPAGPPPVDEPPVDEPPVEAPASGEEDVLEETPEFLQDTPEHDRLWFEQKPPRDFDFGN